MAKKKECYGGAFDIDPYAYWTRDDLNELQSAIEDLNPTFIIQEMYLKNDSIFDITYRDTNDNIWDLSTEIKIDKRKADTPQKLCKVYAPIIKEAIDNELSKNYEDMGLDAQGNYIEDIDR